MMITSPQQVGNFPVYGEVGKSRGNVSNGFWS